MPAIGYVTKFPSGSYRGQLNTLTIHTEIELMPNIGKTADRQPDYRILAQGVEIGAGWIRKSRSSGKSYISLRFAAPEFGPGMLYANLGRAAGHEDGTVFAILWNPGS